MMALPGGRRVGRREREGGRESRNVFCKEMFDDKKELCVIFEAGLGGRERERCNVCEKERIV